MIYKIALKLNRISNVNGFSMIGLTLVIFIIISLIGLEMTHKISSLDRATSSQNLSAKTAATLIHSNLINIFRHNQAWTSILEKNSSLLCVKNGTACTLGTYQIQLVEFDSIKYIDDSDSNLGFSVTGELCFKYSDMTDFTCVFKPIVQWEPICASPCINPSIKIIIDLNAKSNFLNKYILNKEFLKYSEIK